MQAITKKYFFEIVIVTHRQKKLRSIRFAFRLSSQRFVLPPLPRQTAYAWFDSDLNTTLCSTIKILAIFPQSIVAKNLSVALLHLYHTLFSFQGASSSEASSICARLQPFG
jgi:hypothetical protein